MKRSIALPLALAACCCLAANAPPAGAAEISFESRTYAPLGGIEDESTHALLYEYLSLDVMELAPGFSLRLGGWGRADLADETYDQSTNGDLQYAYLDWRGPRLNAEGRLGRISLTSGVARNEVFDGLLLGTDLPGGFDVTAFGGVPVETDEGGRDGDSLYGGRVSQGMPGRYRVGISYLKEENDSEEAREEAGVDVYLYPLQLVEIAGSSLYNVAAESWARHDYRLTLGPFGGKVRVVGTWASTDYRHFFVAVDNPAFEEVDAEEQLDRIGGLVELTLGRGVTLTGEYASYAYDVAESAQSFGGRLDWAGGASAAGAGYRQMQGDADEDRYQEILAHASTAFGALHLAAEVQHLIYEVEINGEKTSTTGNLTFAYALGQGLEVSATGEYGVTPEFESEIGALFALTWRYDASTKKGGTK